ncbi:MAG: DUF4180 domain-containing protein [Bacteroidales bacterium]|nr:DUF4180 domain-containing protein [Bacteroidales bacterium]
MEIRITKHDGVNIAEIISKNIVINEVQDALDLMANCNYQDAERIILSENQLNPDFFDLKTRSAGEVLQKFSNYRNRLAIIGDFSKYESKSLKDFIFESNKGKLVCFVGTVEEAISKLLA